MNKLKQIEEQRQEKLCREIQPDRKIFKLIRVFAVIFILIIVLEVWMVNRLTTYGNKIAQIDSTKSALVLENLVLENAIAENSSLNLIEKKAVLLGFNPIQKVEYLKSSQLASGL